MTQPINLEPADVLAVMQQRFPREYEIAVQAVYIKILEQRQVEEQPADNE